MIGNLEYRMVLIAKIGLTLTNRRFLTQIPALPSSNEWGASALLAYSSTMRKLGGDNKIINESTKALFEKINVESKIIFQTKTENVNL